MMDSHYTSQRESSTIGGDPPEQSEDVMPYALECRHLTKLYGSTPAVSDVSLVVRPGEFTTLVGPSGCGKTTTLRLIAGFETPDSGTIAMGGRIVAGPGVNLPAEQRRIGMVFQEYALFPHLNVADNIGFGLKQNRGEKSARVAEMLALVGLDGLEERMPYELSGGQQQRIALARALAPQPQILLLDEPFSNLDAALRAQVRAEVRGILQRAGITCIFVTHDQEEALSLSDTVVVMFGGDVAQIGTPQMVYTRPASREVAAFIGESNFLPGEAQGDTAVCALGRLPLAEEAYGPVDLLLRPETLRLLPLNSGSSPEVSIDWIEFYGHDQRAGLILEDGTRLIIRSESGESYTAGKRACVIVTNPAIAYSRD
jgi:iron(III) transport system ATP-binding protein